MFSYFRSIKDNGALKHLNVSHNSLDTLDVEGCSSENPSKKIIESMDLSYNHFGWMEWPFDYLKCLQPIKIYLKNNDFEKLDPHWPFFNEHLKYLDLQYNMIKRLGVSLLAFN